MTANYDQVIEENPQVRQPDGRIFTSPGGKAFHRKSCRKLRALTHDDANSPRTGRRTSLRPWSSSPTARPRSCSMMK